MRPIAGNVKLLAYIVTDQFCVPARTRAHSQYNAKFDLSYFSFRDLILNFHALQRKLDL